MFYHLASLLVTVVTAKQAQASVLLSDYTINAQPTVQIFVFPSDSFSFIETNFTVSFPAFIGFQIVQSTPQCYEAPATIQVSNFNNRAPICAFASQADGSVLLTVSNLRTTGAVPPNSYGIQITGLQNPSSATQSQLNGVGVVITTYSQSVENERIQANFFQFDMVRGLQPMSITSNNPQVGSAAQLTFTTTVSQMLPINSTVTIGLPLQNEQFQALGATTQKSMIIEPLMVTATLQNVSVPAIFEVKGSTVYVKLNNNNVMKAGGKMTILLSEMLMPPCLGTFSGFSIATGDNNFYGIESWQSDLKLTQEGISSGSATMSSNGILEPNQTYSFNITTANDLPFNSYFKLTVPNTVVLLPTNVTCYSDCNYSYSKPVLTVRFTNQYLSAPGPLIFRVTGFTNPASSTPSLFKWSSYASLPDGDYLIDSASELAVQAVQGICSISQLSLSDYTIYASAKWTFQLQCQHAFQSVLITIPPQFQLDCTKNTCLQPNTIMVAQSTNMLYGIQNPAQLNINSLTVGFNTTVNSVVIDTGSYVIPPYTVQPGVVQQLTVTPSDFTLGQSPVYYDFQFQPSGDIARNASIVLTIPFKQSQLTLSNPFGFTSSNLTVTILSNVLTISNGFPQSTNQMQMQNEGPIIKFTLGPFKNPRNYDSHIFTLQVSTIQVLYKPLSVGVSMQTPAIFKNITILRDSQQNSNLTNYNFTITPTNEILPNDQLVIQFAQQITLQQTMCYGLSSNLQTNLQCTISNNQITIALNTAGQTLSSSFDLQLTKVKNAASFEPSTINITLLSNNILIEQGSSQITNIVPTKLSSISVLPMSFDTAVLTNYTVQLTPASHVVITVPPQLKLASNFSCSVPCSVTDNLITIDNSTEAGITFGPILNPPPGFQSTDSFKVNTYSKQGYLIGAQTSDLSINFFCVYPCASCDSIIKTQCTSCYIGGSFSAYYNFTCIDTCPAGLALIQSNCTSCAPQCSRCEGAQTNCVECSHGYFMLSPGQCEEIVYYPFPYFVFCAIAFTVVLIAECRNSSSSFKDSFLAFLGIAEFCAWATFTVFCYLKQNLSYTTYGAIIAVGTYLILNLTFAIVHSCKIIKSNDPYRVLMQRSNCVRLFSYLVSFKFSSIAVSNLCQAQRFKGEYTPQNYKDFNAFLLVFMLSAYPLMMACCVYHLIQFGFFNYPGFMAVECIVISTVASAVALMEALSVLSCKSQAVKIGVYKLKSGFDYESDHDVSKAPLKHKRNKVNEAHEFGNDDEDPNISKDITNQTLMQDDIKQMMQKMERERLQEKQMLLDQQKEQLQMIENVMKLHQDPEIIKKYVDDKVMQADTLNKQILREIYEEQMMIIRQQQKKAYRDFEAQMSRQSVEMESGKMRSERISILPLSRYESDHESPLSNAELDVQFQGGAFSSQHGVNVDGPHFVENSHRGGMSSREVVINKKKGVFGQALSEALRSQELNMHQINLQAEVDYSHREFAFTQSQRYAPSQNPVFETQDIASMYGDETHKVNLEAQMSSRDLEREANEQYINLSAMASQRDQAREANEVFHNMSAIASQRDQAREANEVFHNMSAMASQRDHEKAGHEIFHNRSAMVSMRSQEREDRNQNTDSHVEVAVEQVDSSDGPQDFTRRSAQSQGIQNLERIQQAKLNSQTQEHFANHKQEPSDTMTGKLPSKMSAGGSSILSKTHGQTQKQFAPLNIVHIANPSDGTMQNPGKQFQDLTPSNTQRSVIQKGGVKDEIYIDEVRFQTQESPHIPQTFHSRNDSAPDMLLQKLSSIVDASPRFATNSNKQSKNELNVSAKSVREFYDPAFQKVSPSNSQSLNNTPVKKRQVEDAYGHSESSEGIIVNHDLFSTVNHFRNKQTLAPPLLVKARNQSQPEVRQHILYSDRSESSVADMMDDTPSNYNIPNGRLDGKSLGLKQHVNSMQRRKTPESKQSTRRRKNPQMVKSFAENQQDHSV